MIEVKKKIVFIINPISGVGKKNTIPPLIQKHLDLNKFDYQIIYTKHRGHGRELANEFKNQNDIIVAVGGDGSVNEIGSALVGSNCALAILPCGSGNGLARHAKIPLKIHEAIKRINSSKIQKIDVGSVNDKIFLGTCGLGFDAYVAKKFDEYHKRGFISYIRLVLLEYKKYRCKKFSFSYNGQEIEREALMCSVANSSQFGNGFTISPLSDLQDGKFELVFLKKFPLYRVIGIARKFFSASIHKSKNFESFEFSQTAEIRIKNNEITSLHIDGEPAGGGSQFQIKIIPSGLNLI